MKIAYVVGPYRADTDLERWRNIERARNLAAELWQQGYAVICPHANSAFFSGACDEKHFLAGGIEIMLRCADEVHVLPTWKSSSGSVEEIEIAKNSGIHVIYHEAGEQ